MRPSPTLASVVASIAALAVGAFTLAGCGGGTHGDKAGGSGSPIVLRLGTVDTSDRPAGVDLEHFAASVKRLSGGGIAVEIVWGAAQTNRGEQDVAELVRSGKLDAGLVATRAFDVEGVTSLRALQAPFLIDGQALLDRVVTSPLAAEMLAGMRPFGVTGLALLPSDLVHPFGFGRALLAPADFTGARVRVPISAVSYSLWRALGAKPVFLNGDAYNLAVRKGRIDGAEWYLELGDILPAGGGPTTATANVTLYPKVNALVVNSKVYASLTDRQRTVLRRAAADTLGYVVRTNVSEASAAASFCKSGGAIVVSSRADLAALERAVEPVYSVLERDRPTRRLIEQVRDLKSRVPANPAIAPCGRAQSRAAASPAGQAQAGRTIPDGVYRKEITEQELLAAGVSKTDARGNYGLHTLTIKDGRWRDASGIRSPCSGPIRYSGHRVIFTTECGSSTTTLVLNATWRLDRSELRFLGLANVFDRVYWGGRPWRKIG